MNIVKDNSMVTNFIFSIENLWLNLFKKLVVSIIIFFKSISIYCFFRILEKKKKLSMFHDFLVASFELCFVVKAFICESNN